MTSAAYAQIRVREPLGERVLGESITLGGDGTDVVLPGLEPGISLKIRRGKGVWAVEPIGSAARYNGRALIVPCDLRRHDTLAVGDAQVVVADLSRTLLRLDVHHLAGNATVAPTTTLATLILDDEGDGDVEIHPLDTLRVPPLKTAETAPSAPQGIHATKRWWLAAPLIAVLAVIAVLASMLEPLKVHVYPTDARVLTPGTLIALHNVGGLLMLPGKHVVRAERAGYAPAQAEVVVQNDNPSDVRLSLAKLPGKLAVDTGGIAATVSVDGVEVGKAPGVLTIPAGERTLFIRAPRYLDYIANVTIAGAGEHQALKVSLKPSWGTLKVLSIPERAHVAVDGVDSGAAPVTVAAPSGVRRVQITAPGWRTWESSVVLKAGETLEVGPVTLGQPDAHLTVRSEPAGADVTVAGVHLGSAPAEIDLPAGIAHQIVLTAPGYKSWSRAVFADPGRKLSVLARLEPILARVSVQGEPAEADLFIDGAPRGKAPQSLELTATSHRLEVRKAHFQPFRVEVTPEADLDRTIRYHLTPNTR